MGVAADTVVVVGTGVVGLSAALGCAQRGLTVQLLGPVPGAAVLAAHQRVSIADRGAGHEDWDARIYALAPASCALLERQRIWAQIDVRRLCAVEQMLVFGDAGGRLRLSAHAVGATRLATIVEERALLRALWLACSLTPAITHHPAGFESALLPAAAGTVASAAAVDASSAPAAVEVRLRDGQLIFGALLIGADGRRSAVRAAAGINARQGTYGPSGQAAVIANFAAERPHQGIARQYFRADGVLALLPLPDDCVSMVWSVPQPQLAALRALDAAALAERVVQACGAALGGLRLLGQTGAFFLQRLEVDSLVRPAVVLLGDAAHVIHPLAGQGLNLGLQDVAELLRQLDAREPWRALGDCVWLRRYERARAEPLGLMRAAVDGLAWLFGPAGPRFRLARNLGLQAVDALEPAKRLLLRQAMG